MQAGGKGDCGWGRRNERGGGGGAGGVKSKNDWSKSSVSSQEHTCINTHAQTQMYASVYTDACSTARQNNDFHKIFEAWQAKRREKCLWEQNEPNLQLFMND